MTDSRSNYFRRGFATEDSRLKITPESDDTKPTWLGSVTVYDTLPNSLTWKRIEAELTLPADTDSGDAEMPLVRKS